MGEMVKLNCLICFKEFEVSPYREKSAKYCSLKCRSIGVYNDMKDRGCGLAVVDGSHLIGNTHRKGMKPANAFGNGHTPWNKDMKGLHLSPETEFVKGCVPTNKMKVGTVTQRVDKYGTRRNFIKVSEPNSWETYAVFLWKKAYGKVKEGRVIHHINKNALDDRLNNFQMLTRVEHLEVHRNDYKEKQGSRFINDAAVFI